MLSFLLFSSQSNPPPSPPYSFSVSDFDHWLMRMKFTGAERRAVKSWNGHTIPLTYYHTNAMVGPKSWLGGLFNRFGNRRNEKFLGYTLTPIQKALIKLWHIAFPNVVLTGLISEQWKDMGWQGPNPSTDFRNKDFTGFKNDYIYLLMRLLLLKEEGDRATWEYPFAVAGINVSFMLIQMLDLYSEDEEAFDVLYCVAFELMDAQWLAMHASYMEFNVLSLSRSLVAFTS
ncbi:hypothetical protein GOBAR_AA06423 [Gossypium barbadense]|uniref:ELMO domain-containing protein n=1 Tax=Gossypium barbadense TaxID=3634 RepID=A0A2P5YF08_GOSBA|nr:hypothetical protein GOBAR_AA06423 [Gossypium barbadense]